MLKENPTTSNDKETFQILKKSWKPTQVELNEIEKEEKLNSNISQKRAFKVCIRVRPLLNDEVYKHYDATTAVNNSVFIHKLQQRFNKKSLETKLFSVDQVFDTQSTNEDVYESINHLIPLILEGGVGTVFTYGQTGSGKTHTMTGIENLVAKNIFSDILHKIFGGREGYEKFLSKNPSYIPKFKEYNQKVIVSFFEIYGETISDLLNNKNKLDLSEDVFGAINITGGLVEVEVNDTESMLELIKKGSAFRNTKATFKNDTSSRSHAVFQIKIINFSDYNGAEAGCLYIVDLAGSESGADTQHHNKEQIAESVAINKSLAALKDCIRNRSLAVTSKRHIHIPYRNSKLTLLLKESFELDSNRQCETVVIATCSPTEIDTAQTLNTLRYIAPLKVNLPPSTYDAENPASWNNVELRKWVKENGVFENGSRVDPNKFCPRENGKQICLLHEEDILERLTLNGIGYKNAKLFHFKLWNLALKGKAKKHAIKGEMEKTQGKPIVAFKERWESGKVALDFDDQLKLLLSKEKEGLWRCCEIVKSDIGGYEVRVDKLILAEEKLFNKPVLLTFDEARKVYELDI
ncbi:hypothetical protein HK099_001424 [Clydaea vesicula]|uniref:Kinesin motor domain-containing protein n=1 Tax=Clydaea vesicula TaxID=447962 RepID=A0AAD5XZA5_9FUNG|nr:hypothetical protein HK099_001424 [Clydaea vesicula]KAJ3389812.1 hypothetical protein HDU92_000872 [Lobulomyces angularis]